MSDTKEKDGAKTRSITVTRSSVQVDGKRRDGLIQKTCVRYGRTENERKAFFRSRSKWDRAMLFEQIEAIEDYARAFARQHGHESTLDLVDGEMAGMTKPDTTLEYAWRLELRAHMLRGHIDDFEQRVKDEHARRGFYVATTYALALVDDFNVLRTADLEPRLVAYAGHYDQAKIGAKTERQKAAVQRWHELLKADPVARGRKDRADKAVATEYGVARTTVVAWRGKHDR